MLSFFHVTHITHILITHTELYYLSCIACLIFSLIYLLRHFSVNVINEECIKYTLIIIHNAAKKYLLKSMIQKLLQKSLWFQIQKHNVHIVLHTKLQTAEL